MTREAPPARIFPLTQNYRGRPVGVWLGAAFVGAVVGSIGLTELVAWIARGNPGPSGRGLLWMLAGCLAVFLAGLYDDFRPARTRGLVVQIRALFEGRVTSGLIKLVIIGASAAAVTGGVGVRGWRFGFGTAVLAGCANVWNLLDVRPGRALKFFLPVVGVLTVLAPAGGYPALGATAFGAGAVALVADLREWAMLGDGGANVLGFVVGLGLLIVLPTAGLVVAIVAIVALHAVSESVTLSRVIGAVPPLQWFDELGRLGRHEGQGSTST